MYYDMCMYYEYVLYIDYNMQHTKYNHVLNYKIQIDHGNYAGIGKAAGMQALHLVLAYVLDV